MQNTAKINALPDDAPMSAIMAAWAGEDFNRFDYTKKVVSDEPTIRRWLLDGGVHVSQGKMMGLYFAEFRYSGMATFTEQSADSPEAAFTAAVEQFAEHLSEKAKHDAEHS